MKFTSAQNLGHSAGGRVIFLSFIVTLWCTEKYQNYMFERGEKIRVDITSIQTSKKRAYIFFLREIVVNSARFFSQVEKVKWKTNREKRLSIKKLLKISCIFFSSKYNSMTIFNLYIFDEKGTLIFYKEWLRKKHTSMDKEEVRYLIWQ